MSSSGICSRRVRRLGEWLPALVLQLHQLVGDDRLVRAELSDIHAPRPTTIPAWAKNTYYWTIYRGMGVLIVFDWPQSIHTLGIPGGEQTADQQDDFDGDSAAASGAARTHDPDFAAVGDRW